MTEQEAQEVKTELEAAHPALEWAVSSGERGVWRVTGRDPVRNRSVFVGRTQRQWYVTLSISYGLWVSDEFERCHVRPYGATGWSEQSASEAMREAIALLEGRWQSAEVDRAWWLEALKAYRADLMDTVGKVDARLAELEAQAAGGGKGEVGT